MGILSNAKENIVVTKGETGWLLVRMPLQKAWIQKIRNIAGRKWDETRKR